MRRYIIFLFVIFNYLSAGPFKYEIASAASRNDNNFLCHPELVSGSNKGFVFDSLRRLPPRLRGFGNEDYFQTFIKPRQRDSLNVRCVGRWPFGPGFEVYGNAITNILCFGAGSGVLVFDISNPSNPVRLSQIAVNGLIMQIYIKDTLLFFSSYGNGIEVFNLANPSSPIKISQINVSARDFCIKDTFAYCVAEDSLRIVNIANLNNPYQVGACRDSSYTISISGNYVYTGGRWKLSAINVSNPANPQVVNYLPLWVYTLTADGNHLYCVIHATPGFRIYNISNPLNIWQEGQLNVGGVNIYKLGFYVYLPGFVIVDVGDSANPFVVGDTSLPVYAQAVWVNNNFGYAYIANDCVGLTPININNPTNPTAQNSIYGADDSRDVFVQGNYAYVSNANKGLKILDITTPSNPYEVGEYDTTGINPDLEALWIRDSIAYLSVGWPLRFRTINISNPSSPYFIGECTLLNIGTDMVVRDSLAYSLGSGRILQIVKITDPSSPDTFPRYYLPNYTSAYAIFLQDSFAYIANADSGLGILNVSNPAAPFEVGHFDNPPGGYATGIFVKDSLAYFASGAPGLRIINVKDPTNPQEVGYYITTGSARDVIVFDSLAYVAAAGVRVIKIKDPITPVEVGYYLTSDAPNRLFYNGSYIFVACFKGGMNILEWLGVGIIEHDIGTSVSRTTEFDIYPNPVGDFILLRFALLCPEVYEISVYDIQGRRLLCLDKGLYAKRVTCKYNLRDLPGGVYFAVLKTVDMALVKKFVVVH
ncbi:MAG: T9SS type A sorting domain-containing protein [candidate division WOR-3 bacterium]